MSDHLPCAAGCSRPATHWLSQGSGGNPYCLGCLPGGSASLPIELATAERKATFDALIAQVEDGGDNQQQPTTAEQFDAKLLSVDQLLELPAPLPLIDGILYRDTLAVLFGMPGAAKSFLALDWALRVAAGSAWLGGFGVHQGPVLYVAAEGGHGIGQRVQAWKQARGIEPPAAFRLYPDVVNLLIPGQVDTVCAWAAQAKPVLIVFDTLARAIPGADENSARDMGLAVQGADRLRAAAGSTVLLVHHTGKDGMDARGSSALRGAADTMVKVENDDGRVKVTCEKEKDAKPFQPLRLRLEEVKVKDGTSCVLRELTPLEGSATEVRHSRRIFQALQGPFGSLGASGKVLREHLAMSEATFSRGINLLVSEGKAVNEGSQYRPIWKVVAEVADQ